MKRLLAACAMGLSVLAMSFAGDAAVFQDIGFSQDGKVYIFAQYGKVDKSFQAWAEIYTVDVPKNVFIKSDVYKTNPSYKTVSMSGKEAYDQLFTRSEYQLSKYKFAPVSGSNVLYVNEDERADPTQEIVFKDWDNSTASEEIFYAVKLVPTVTGKGKAVKSQFYINFEKRNSKGEVLLSKKVGTPDFKRDGISAYRIARIFSDKSGKNLVFVVEKLLEDDTGTSIRYMVETVSL